MRIVLLLLFSAVPCFVYADEIISFQTAKIADEQSIRNTKAFLEAVYRQHYRKYDMEGVIEIEIINPPNEPLGQRWEENESGGTSLYVYWMYHVWYNGIHMDCYDAGLPTIKNKMCPYRQEVDPEDTSSSKTQANK